MRTRTAICIVKKCIAYKDKYGFWPTPMSRSDNKNIIHAFKLVNYRQGDFSFIKNQEKRTSLEHDYKVISRLNAWNALRNHDSFDEFIDDTNGGIWDFIYYYMYFYHSKESAKINLIDLQFISKNGWHEYVLKSL